MFDIVVIGGGHAGVEAALAASRMGRKVALVTMDSGRLAVMSCNPAIGGIGKSHLVKEIDAMGGIMAEAIDATGIQFRKLNLSRGAAVWSTRAQADRIAYNSYVVKRVAADPNIEIIEGLVEKLLVEQGRVVGVQTACGRDISASAVVVASGTFLGGLIHIGEKQIKAGRYGEQAAYGLTQSLIELGFETGRLKTGTPPRLDGDTIDFSQCELQPGLEPIPFFSHRTIRQPFKQTPCHLTYTTEQTKQVITANFERSPIFSGQIQATGPRYCPSIEDKFYRFADKARHQLFLEPEGNGTNEVYPNGFSTSLPEEIQLEAIRTVVGLERCDITRPGYAVEYDYCPACQIRPSLETLRVQGLFFAGQINGTSGYEEAAAQGLMAGINASLHLEMAPPLVLDRSQAYTGVMIDDLTTRSTTEPYRMFTSRAEYRLAMREDNARDRLAPIAAQYGLISGDEYRELADLQKNTNKVIAYFKRQHIRVCDLGPLSSCFKKAESVSLAKLFKLPGVSQASLLELLAQIDGCSTESPEEVERAAIMIKYEGYITKQDRDIARFHKMESAQIPDEFDYAIVTGLKREALEKFGRYRPYSLGQAGRLEGVTPGDLAILSVYLKRHKEAHGSA